jgi:hypothetical protein
MLNNRINPAQARERFGELTVRVGLGLAHRAFEADEGIWRPVFDENLQLRGYKLHLRPGWKAPAPHRPIMR